MSHATQTSAVSISPDEIHDLLVNGEESLVTLECKTIATLRNVTEHSTRKVGIRAAHEFECILTLDTIYEHKAKVHLTENEDKTEFTGTIAYLIFQGKSMAE